MKNLINRKNYRKLAYVLIGVTFLCLGAFVILSSIADNADNAAYSKASLERYLASIEAESTPPPSTIEADSGTLIINMPDWLNVPDVPPQRPELRTAATVCLVLCFVSIAALLALGIAFGRCPDCGSFQGRGIRGTYCKWCGGALD